MKDLSAFKSGKIDHKRICAFLACFWFILLEETNKIINGDKAEIKTYISSVIILKINVLQCKYYLYVKANNLY